MFNNFFKYNKLLNTKPQFFIKFSKPNMPLYKINNDNDLFNKNNKIQIHKKNILETPNFKYFFFISLTFTYFGLFMYYVYI